MRKLFILFLCVCVPFVGLLLVRPCFSKETDSSVLDGYEWERWPEYTKMVWVCGFMGGTWMTHREGSIMMLSMIRAVGETLGIEEKDLEESKELKKFFEIFDKYDKGFDFKEVSPDQLVEGLNKFYRDYRNKKIVVPRAIWIVKVEILGAPEECIEYLTMVERRSVRMFRNRGGVDSVKEDLKYKEAWKKWSEQIPMFPVW